VVIGARLGGKTAKSDVVFLVAVVALTRCRTILVERGRFRQAADREKNIAELYKNEANDPRKALESFEQAGDWYLQEGASA
jgi:alpha-soluble NSF attachment protein